MSAKTITDVTTALLGAVLWSQRPCTGLLELVKDADLDPPAATLLAAVRRLVDADKPVDPALVCAELRRTGQLSKTVADVLREATTCGAVPEATQEYAAAVVGISLRRQTDSAAHALREAAESQPEAVLPVLAKRWLRAIEETAARLNKLRRQHD